MPNVRILADLMFVPANLDLLEMAQFVRVREYKMMQSFGPFRKVAELLYVFLG